MALFSRKPSASNGVEGPADDTPQRDLRKARRFFEHAQATADTGNFDYSIDCYINGLRHDPDNVGKHEALHEVAKRRKVNGGKPASFTDKLKSGGKSPLDKMLHAQMLAAKDPTNAALHLEVMKQAVAADAAEPELHMAEVANFVGNLALQWNTQSKKPDKKIYLEVCDLFAAIKLFDKATEACRRAVQMDPSNSALLQKLKDLEAERTMQEGKYGQQFRETIKDADKQSAMEQDRRTDKTESAIEAMVKRRRAEYDEDPQDVDRMIKLVDALVQMQTPDSENEAIKLLKDTWESTGQYRFRVRMGDIQMRQVARAIRTLRTKLEANPGDADLKGRYVEAQRKAILFELSEYQDRVKNYPTDLSLKFELGRRLYLAGKIDEAISAFQQATGDPKHRAASYEYLGRCFLKREWYDEAVDTVRKGIEAHPLKDDRLALELRYLLIEGLEGAARRNRSLEQAREAQRVASQVLQTKIDFRDIRDRVEQLRKLVDELNAPAA